MTKAFLVGASLAAWALAAAPLQALPSWDPKDTFQVTLENGAKSNVTLLRDHQDLNRFYHLPLAPRLALRNIRIGDTFMKNVPRFALTRYQFTDPDDPQNLLEGGFLQFVVDTGLNTDQVEELKTQIQASVPGMKGKPVVIGQIPIRKGRIHLYEPKSGTYVATGGPASYISKDLSEALPFKVKLDLMSTGFADSLSGTGQGLGVWYSYEVDVLTPPIGFKVEIDWKETYRLLDEKNPELLSLLLQSSYLCDPDGTTPVIHKNGEKSGAGCLTLTYVNMSDEQKEEAQRYLPAVYAKMQATLFPGSQALVPAIIATDRAPGRLQLPKPGALPNGAAQRISKGNAPEGLLYARTTLQSETVDFSRRTVMPVKKMLGGSLDISDQDEQVRKVLVTRITESDDQNAYLILPTIVTTPAMGLTRIDMSVQAIAEGYAPGKVRTVTWTPTDKDKGGAGSWVELLSGKTEAQERDNLQFGMGAWKDKLGQEFPRNMKFDIVTTIQNRGGTLVDKEKRDMFTGKALAATPMDKLTTVSVATKALRFNSEPEMLRSAIIKLRDPAVPDRLMIRRVPEDVPPGRTVDFLILADEHGNVNYELDVDFIFGTKAVIGSQGAGRHRWSGSGQQKDTYVFLDRLDWIDGGTDPAQQENRLREKCITGRDPEYKSLQLIAIEPGSPVVIRYLPMALLAKSTAGKPFKFTRIEAGADTAVLQGTLRPGATAEEVQLLENNYSKALGKKVKAEPVRLDSFKFILFEGHGEKRKKVYTSPMAGPLGSDSLPFTIGPIRDRGDDLSWEAELTLSWSEQVGPFSLILVDKREDVPKTVKMETEKNAGQGSGIVLLSEDWKKLARALKDRAGADQDLLTCRASARKIIDDLRQQKKLFLLGSTQADGGEAKGKDDARALATLEQFSRWLQVQVTGQTGKLVDVFQRIDIREINTQKMPPVTIRLEGPKGSLTAKDWLKK